MFGNILEKWLQDFVSFGSPCIATVCNNINIDVDIDECELEQHNCGAHAACNNTAGSYNCTCISGYEGDGINCSGKCVY